MSGRPACADRRLARRPLGDRVYQVLWERLLDRRVRPGEKLSDLRLSDELGVSRTPVREALLRLVQEGMVRAEPNRGFYVASFSARDVEEIYALRATLEATALELAIPVLDRATLESALVELDRCEASYAEAATEEDRRAAADAFLDIDRAFHRMVVVRGGNSRLTAIAEGLWAQIAVFQETGVRRGWAEVSIRHHRAIIVALLNGDAMAAVAALRFHIDEIKRMVLADLARDRNGHGDSAGPARSGAARGAFAAGEIRS
jgi:DNA-binding GntR family transcriptional regulator